MPLRILFEKNKPKPRLYQQQDDFALESTGTGWPKDTWFQKRLRYVREQQLNQGTGADVVSERPLGIIKLKRSNGGDS
jgi:hypothetical protein